MQLAKLDNYRYDFLGPNISILLDSSSDPDLADIMSEINRSKGRIYVEGRYYTYLNRYKLNTIDGNTYLELTVEED